MLEMARKLEGVVRNGKHAGGVVIAPTKLTDFSPIYCNEEGGGLVTQFDKDDVESAGPGGEVRLPRSANPDGDRLGAEAINRDRAKVDEPPLDIAFYPAGRQTDLPVAGQRPPRGVPA